MRRAWEQSTHHHQGADQHIRRLAIGADHLGDKVAGHANDGDEGDELHGAHRGEGVPEGAKLRHAGHGVVAAVLEDELLFERFGGGEEGELRSELVVVQGRPQREVRGGAGDARGGLRANFGGVRVVELGSSRN